MAHWKVQHDPTEGWVIYRDGRRKDSERQQYDAEAYVRRHLGPHDTAELVAADGYTTAITRRRKTRYR